MVALLPENEPRYIIFMMQKQATEYFPMFILWYKNHKPSCVCERVNVWLGTSMA